MQYKNNVKIIIDKRKLDILFRLGCCESAIIELLKNGKVCKTGDSLIDETLETLIDIKEFSNWGGSRKNSGRKKKNQDENHLENQDESNLEDKDKDIDLFKFKFIKPSIEQIRTYCTERKNNINAEQFFDFYESKGWKIGKSPMKDWKASVRTWERKKGSNDNIPEVANSKIPEEVYIDSGQFFLDNTFEEFSDMTDEQCNSCARWLLEKFRYQTLKRDNFIKIARKFKK